MREQKAHPWLYRNAGLTAPHFPFYKRRIKKESENAPFFRFFNRKVIGIETSYRSVFISFY
jgi:hypothetical protein